MLDQYIQKACFRKDRIIFIIYAEGVLAACLFKKEVGTGNPVLM